MGIAFIPVSLHLSNGLIKGERLRLDFSKISSPMGMGASGGAYVCGHAHHRLEVGAANNRGRGRWVLHAAHWGEHAVMAESRAKVNHPVHFRQAVIQLLLCLRLSLSLPLPLPLGE